MKKTTKTNLTKLLVILMVIMTALCVLPATVRAAEAWTENEDKTVVTLTLRYGENVGKNETEAGRNYTNQNILLIKDHINTDNDGSGGSDVFTFEPALNGEGIIVRQPGRSFGNANMYPEVTVNPMKVGTETYTVTFTPENGNGGAATTTALTVKCVYTEDVQALLKAVGCTDVTETTFTALADETEMTTDLAKSILSADVTKYDELNDAEKDLIDDAASHIAGVEDAEDAVETAVLFLAEEFIDTYDLDAEELSKDTDEKMLGAQTPWTSLDVRVQDAVEDILEEEFDALMTRVQNHLNQTNADAFVDGNDIRDFDMDKFDIEVSGKDNVELANKVIELGSENGAFAKLPNNDTRARAEVAMGVSMEEMVEAAEEYLLDVDTKTAEEFIFDNLMIGENVITQADVQSAPFLMDAENKYNALNDRTKEMVNAMLTEIFEAESYTKMLGDAPAFLVAAAPAAPVVAKAATKAAATSVPKTGDAFAVVVSVLAIAGLGFALTFKRK